MKPQQGPKTTDFVAEGLRATWEAAVMMNPYFWNRLVAMTPEGDGRPVMVLPGFGCDDTSTYLLRRFLKEKNYAVYEWDEGTNTGISDAIAARTHKRIEEIAEKHGRKVALVGHSLGGIFAQELARAAPGAVAQVITLGSPFGDNKNRVDAVQDLLRMAFEAVNPAGHKPNTPDGMKPLPMPMTSIYTKHDGVVGWRMCLTPEDAPMAENIDVSHGGGLFLHVHSGASHLGLVNNPLSLIAIADRLAQKDGAWRKFDPGAYPDVTHAFAGKPEKAAAGGSSSPAPPPVPPAGPSAG